MMLFWQAFYHLCHNNDFSTPNFSKLLFFSIEKKTLMQSVNIHSVLKYELGETTGRQPVKPL